MKKYGWIAFALFVCIILQETWMYGLRIGNAQPNLVLLCVIFYSLLHGWQGGAVVGIGAGLFMDLCSGYSIGLTAISLMLTGILLGLLIGEFYKDNYFIIIIATALGSFSYSFFYWLGTCLLGNEISFWGALFHNFFPNMIYNCIIACILYFPLFFFYLRNKS